MEKIGLSSAALGVRALRRRGAGGRQGDRLPGHPAPELHDGRHRRRHRLYARPSSTEGRAGRSTRARPSEVLVEESVLGWKEFELEVIRDRADNFIVVCSIENIDPMGVHTGDSITVAPAMTLTDREFQRLRDAARAVMTEIGVETGGSNVQFAVNPKDGRVRRHRDEPARVALERARVEGDRLSDRQDRRQARGRLQARRAGERHHQDQRRLRADHRLRRREVAALRVREVPRRREPPRHADEERRRGRWPSGARSPRRCRRRRVRWRPGATGSSSLYEKVDYVALAAAPLVSRDLAMEAPPEPSAKANGMTRSPGRASRGARQAGGDRHARSAVLRRRRDARAGGDDRRRALQPHRDRPLVPRADAPHRARRGASSISRQRRCARPSGSGFSDAQIAARRRRRRRAAVRAGSQRARHQARVPAGRHLRRRVRRAHAVPLLDVRDARARARPPIAAR